MDKHKLASELRECQRQLGQAPAFFIENLPDELIIDAYVTCHNCQARLVDDDTLEKCIGGDGPGAVSVSGLVSGDEQWRFTNLKSAWTSQPHPS